MKMTESEALHVLQKEDVKISGKAASMESFSLALSIAKHSMKKRIGACPTVRCYDAENGNIYLCPSCGIVLGRGARPSRTLNYCPGCGQRLDLTGFD